MTKIELPSAEELDTGSTSQGYQIALYLIPAKENGGIPCVTTHEGVGNIGYPEPAYHRRWYHLASYGQDVCGESVLAALEEQVDYLIAHSDTYQGSEWDGSNVKGNWANNDDSVFFNFFNHSFYESLTHYWNASDYLSHGGVTWEELCCDSGVDVERTDDAAIELIAAQVNRDADCDGVRLSRTEQAIKDIRDEWITEKEED